MPNIPVDFRFNVFLVKEYKKVINLSQVLWQKSVEKWMQSQPFGYFCNDWFGGYKPEDLQNIMDREWIK